MTKLNRFHISFLIICFGIFFISCEKDVVNDTIISNDGLQQRLSYTDQGYTEVEIKPINPSISSNLLEAARR